ncbi:MAG TPA: beta-ketoacyl synthase N-terminal-like domain-containing protein [Verrucomicrobiae bacterium]|nr:beta-ketoacyl synthase N-terminal-like domain-containing protein [Verrucomicrobiae bacterium]
MSDSTRIVITGTGAVCGSGLDVDSIWDAIVNGRSAIKEISSWDAGNWPTRMAAEVVDVNNRTLVEDRKLHKLLSRTDLFGLYAAGAAIQNSGVLAHREALAEEAVAPFNDRSGVLAGSGGGNYRSNYDFFPLMTAAAGDMMKFGTELDQNVNPMWLLKILPNNVVCHVGIRHSFKGTNACITNQCVGGAMAIAEAAASIRAGEADRAVAVGHDSPFEPETVFNYHRLGLMSPDTLRPFDCDRRGTIFGEGAAAALLETLADAQGRGADILGEFLGSGCTTEATGVLGIRPDGDGLSRAIEMALDNAGIRSDEVGMIVAHGNGTHASDASEAQALRRVFGGSTPPVTGFKWAFGHLIAASGALDLVLTLRALRERIVPGIATLNELDPELPQIRVSRSPQSPLGDIALVLCRGFGGMNVALLVRAQQSLAS